MAFTVSEVAVTLTVHYCDSIQSNSSDFTTVTQKPSRAQGGSALQSGSKNEAKGGERRMQNHRQSWCDDSYVPS